MAEAGRKLECLQPVLRSQFEDVCHSVNEQCHHMLAQLFEACLVLDEKIRQEKHVRAKPFTKLVVSNSLNDVQFLCIKQFEEITQGFFKNLSLPDAMLPTDTSESMKVISYILKRASACEDTSSSQNTSNITPLESQASDARQVSLYKNYLQDRVASKHSDARRSASKSFEAESGKAVRSNLFQISSVGDTESFVGPRLLPHPDDEERSDSAGVPEQAQHDSDEGMHGSDMRGSGTGRKMYELFKKSSSAKRAQKSGDSSHSSSNESNDDANNSINEQYAHLSRIDELLKEEDCSKAVEVQQFVPVEEVRSSEPVRRLNPKNASFVPQLPSPLEVPPLVLDQLVVVEHPAHSSKTLSPRRTAQDVLRTRVERWTRSRAAGPERCGRLLRRGESAAARAHRRE